MRINTLIKELEIIKKEKGNIIVMYENKNAQYNIELEVEKNYDDYLLIKKDDVLFYK